MKKILVMMSTYNGEKYIGEQIQSIINQKQVKVDIIIRDDGSTDHTVDKVNQYIEKYNNIKLIVGENIGWRGSFKQLFQIKEEYDYYAFSDQDDVWLDNKLINAIHQMVEIDKGCLYYSNSILVDDKLNVIKDKFGKCPPKEKLTALVQNFAQGCTIVYNKIFHDQLIQYNCQYDFPHDIWLPIIALYTGQLIYDENAYFCYRQHASNVVGGGYASYIEQFRHRINSINKNEVYYYFALELLNGYKEYIEENDIKELEFIVGSNHSFSKKIKLLTDHRFRKDTWKGNILLAFTILFSKFKDEK